MLSAHDPITGTYDQLFSLFYEVYRGYTIYSTEQGCCCIHGPGNGGCVRMQGHYVVFPDIEEAKTLMKWFLAHQGTTPQSTNWHVPREAYICLNPPRREEGTLARLDSCRRPNSTAQVLAVSTLTRRA